MMMVLLRCSFGVLLILLPLQIPLTPDDSVSTSLQIIGSHGQYAAISRSCEGDELNKEGLQVTEVAVSAQHTQKSWLNVGIDGGIIRSKKKEGEIFNGEFNEPVYRRQNFAYAVPHLDFNASWRSSRRTGCHWTGGRQRMCFRVFISDSVSRGFFISTLPSLCRSLPLSHGYFTMGLGSKASKKTNWWVGISGLPYDGAGLLTRVDFRMGPAVQLTTSLRLGTSEGISENALGIGLRFTH
jgi:hypothetical protein